MFEGKSIRVVPGANGIVELCFDAKGQSINKLDSATVEELGAATAAIRSAGTARGVLVTSAKDAFIVGADIFEFTTLFSQSEAQIEAHMRHSNAIFSGFEDLAVPTVVAINGLALGGGLEMALTCDARVMSDATQIGLPEVSLGLFPGFGGTVRLPRVAGAAAAIEYISTGKPQSARAALASGLVDKVVPAAEVRQAATSLLEALIASGEWRARRQKRQGPFQTDAAAFADARKKLAKTAVHQPAALAAVDLMEQSAGDSRDAALKREHVVFGRIARTQAASSLIQLFISDQAIKKKARELTKIAHKTKRAAVLGAGIMGGGIAYTSAVRGTPVLMKDIQQSALDLGVSEARKQLNKQVESGRLTADKAAAVLAEIHPQLDYQDIGSVDIVVEAVVEKMSIKQAVLGELEPLVGSNTIIASNTSSLSISEMASKLKRPENFVGMHFFNPVPVMPLVEVIRGAKTSDEAAATVVGYASALGKTPIVVKECPGFLVNRILTPYLLGCLHALHAGADYLQIDRVMEAFGWPMGPTYLADVVGLDTLLHVLDVISGGFADRMKFPGKHAVQTMVEHKRFGQKNGAGFYRYETDPKGKPRKAVDPQTATLIASTRSGPEKAFSDEELTDRLMLPMIIEAARCLEEGIAATAAEVDMSLILGLGFPRHVGGPLKFADWLGMQQVVARCAKLESLGPLYRSTDAMKAAARDGRRYF
jgi:3-hydroxyacyl-CoA dehydrogenase / enoyl-CoA hydratase / 3-hydroxybutyryl-CoA epimerase / enoyl-CoA isomerase